jgi:hypothetical protein
MNIPEALAQVALVTPSAQETFATWQHPVISPANPARGVTRPITSRHGMNTTV